MEVMSALDKSFKGLMDVGVRLEKFAKRMAVAGMDCMQPFEKVC